MPSDKLAGETCRRCGRLPEIGEGLTDGLCPDCWSNGLDRHVDRTEGDDHATIDLGEMDGIALETTSDGPVLFLHGEKKTTSVLINDVNAADGLEHAVDTIKEVLNDHER